MLTADQKIRYRSSELESFVAARVIGFIVAAKNATGLEMAELLVRHAERMQSISMGIKLPAAFAIYRNGPPVPLTIRRSRGR